MVNEEKKLINEARNILEVTLGERGISQSEGVYQHIRKIPALVEQVFALKAPALTLAAVAVSSVPRDTADSFMPVFKVGETIGRCIAASNALPLFSVSHQINHILAGRWSALGPEAERFLALHVSGGTTELHEVSFEKGFVLHKIGQTMDLHAGQFVDRVGVALGLPFPAGMHLEELALKTSHTRCVIPSCVRDNLISFSGPESHAQRLISAGNPREEIALAVLTCIAKSLEKLLRPALEKTELKDILIVGGVASNRIIRSILQKRLAHPAVGARLYFAAPEYSRDNAVGTALWACEQFQRDQSKH
jgi:N6-L-threonylcarbamoyladenine synthase